MKPYAYWMVQISTPHGYPNTLHPTAIKVIKELFDNQQIEMNFTSITRESKIR